jgi:hypothetical protein
MNLTCNLFEILVALIFLYLNGQETASSSKGAQAVYHLFQLLGACTAASFPFMCVFGHPELRKHAKLLLICFRKGPSVAPLFVNEARNAIGMILIPKRINERELHFATLNEIWNQ